MSSTEKDPQFKCEAAGMLKDGGGSGSQGPPKWRSSRFCLAYMVSTGLMVVFYQRVSFSMAIVCMVNHTALSKHHQHQQQNGDVSAFNRSFHKSETWDPALVSFEHVRNMSTTTSMTMRTRIMEDSDEDRCGRSRNTTEKNNEDGPFAWDRNIQGLLLGAMYWGFLASQVPGSYAIQRKGARLVVGVSVILMSLFHALCHPAAFWSPWAVFALRVCIGLCSGLSVPGMYSVWGRWAPVAERTQLLGIAFAGPMIANASVFPASAFLCEHGFWGGWPSVYYVLGLLGLLWSIIWFMVVFDTPETHTRICPSEKDYIINTRSEMGLHKEKVAVPWRSILSAPCFWAIVVSHFSFNWGFFLMLSNLPIFMYETMNFDIQSNGVYSMLPYLFLFVTTISAGFVSDFIVSRRLLSVVGSRKFFSVLGHITPAVLLVVMSHQDCRQVARVMSLLVVSVAMTGLANTAGFYINPYDIAPRFAINICTASNTMATAAGVINPYVVAYVTADQTREQWQTVFYITAAIFAFGTVFFCLFARGDVQPWGATPAVQETIIHFEDSRGKEQHTIIQSSLSLASVGL